MREVITLLFLGINAYTDIREKSVYLLAVLPGAVIGMIMACYEMCKIDCVRNRQVIMLYLIIPIVMGVVLYLISKLTGGEIGEGDGFVLASTGICVGTKELICVITYSSIVCGVFALGLFLTKMAPKGKKIPLIPFVLTGFVIRLVQVYR